VARGPEPRLLAELSSGVTTCSSDPDLASLSSWAPALTHVPWLWALPPREESFGAVTCSSAPDPVSLSRWAPALPRGSGLTSLRGELRYCHVPHGPQQAMTTEIKKGITTQACSWARMCLKHGRVLSRRLQDVWTCATVRFNSAT
jgi:hypothetical protein